MLEVCAAALPFCVCERRESESTVATTVCVGAATPGGVTTTDSLDMTPFANS